MKTVVCEAKYDRPPTIEMVAETDGDRALLKWINDRLDREWIVGCGVRRDGTFRHMELLNESLED